VLVNRAGTRWYGCAKGRGRVRELRTIEPPPDCIHVCESIERPLVGGTHAVWIYRYQFSYGGGADDEDTQTVEVYDLIRGRRAGSYPAPAQVQQLPTGARSTTSSVLAVAISPGGTVAALVADAGTPVLQLHPLRGDGRELDRGNIDPGSLSISSGAVLWTKDGQPKSLPLGRGA
jgi:hypothetical protein